MEENSLVSAYIKHVEDTNKLEKIEDLLLGLVGEIGTLMSPAKKLARDKESYGKQIFIKDTTEELGDILWYFIALCQKCNKNFNDIISNLPNQQSAADNIAELLFTSLPECPVVIRSTLETPEKKQQLLEFSLKGIHFVSLIMEKGDFNLEDGIEFLKKYQSILVLLNLSFHEITTFNINKTSSRFLGINPEPDYFDKGFDIDEQLPRKFEIEIVVKNNKTYMKWNGVRIGDPLTDNHASKDGYKYHDVFHLAYAAILRWSPVFRALIKHKRKSSPYIDETQDGGRAIVIEEGISVWLYSQAKEHDFFKQTSSLSYDILKTVQQFTHGYEVEACSLFLWEKAILQGYQVFNKLKEKGQGRIIGDLEKRTLEYREF